MNTGDTDVTVRFIPLLFQLSYLLHIGRRVGFEPTTHGSLK